MKVTGGTYNLNGWEYKYNYGYYPEPLVNLLNGLIKNDFAFYFERSEIKSEMEAFKVKLITSKSKHIEFIVGEKGQIVLNYPEESKHDKIILSKNKFEQDLLINLFKEKLNDIDKVIYKMSNNFKLQSETLALLKLLKAMYKENYVFKSCSDCKDEEGVFYICNKNDPLILITRTSKSYFLSMEDKPFIRYYLKGTMNKFNSITKIIQSELSVDNMENMELPF